VTRRSVLSAVAVVVVAACLVVAAGVAIDAHEVTYKGTVISVAAMKIAVDVIQDAPAGQDDRGQTAPKTPPKSPKTTPMTFAVDGKTRIYRGDTAMSMTDAKIQKDERVAVTVDHDEAGMRAVEIRLAARR
jgi:hypothetical protein